jgi:hypothetical protein
MRGSGRSRKNCFSKAAICTGCSVLQSTEDESRSRATISSFRRRMFPVFLNIPSTDISATQQTSVNRVNRYIYICNIKHVPICRIAEITSSMKLGTLSVALDAPCNVSAPSRSTSSSNGTPKRPSDHSSHHQLPRIPPDGHGDAPFFLMFFLSFPLNSLPQNPGFFTSTISKISSKST